MAASRAVTRRNPDDLACSFRRRARDPVLLGLALRFPSKMSGPRYFPWNDTIVPK